MSSDPRALAERLRDLSRRICLDIYSDANGLTVPPRRQIEEAEAIIETRLRQAADALTVSVNEEMLEALKAARAHVVLWQGEPTEHSCQTHQAMVKLIDTAIANAEALIGQPWRPIETAPEKGRFIVFVPLAGAILVEVAHLRGEPWLFVYNPTLPVNPYGNAVTGATHWQPLPVPPLPTVSQPEESAS